jgi:hypothetical protein
MACRDCAPASSAEEEPLSPPAATAARARLAVAGGALRHGGTTARERDRDSGLATRRHPRLGSRRGAARKRVHGDGLRGDKAVVRKAFGRTCDHRRHGSRAASWNPGAGKAGRWESGLLGFARDAAVYE